MVIFRFLDWCMIVYCCRSYQSLRFILECVMHQVRAHHTHIVGESTSCRWEHIMCYACLIPWSAILSVNHSSSYKILPTHHSMHKFLFSFYNMSKLNSWMPDNHSCLTELYSPVSYHDHALFTYVLSRSCYSMETKDSDHNCVLKDKSCRYKLDAKIC